MEYEYSPHGDVDEYRDHWLSEDQSDLSDEEIRDRMNKDDLYFDEKFNDLIRTLDTALQNVPTASNIYYVKGQNIGWRNHTGERLFELQNAETLVEKITPNTDWSMTVKTSNGGSTLHLTVSHHDSPTGEPYTIVGVDEAVATTYHQDGEKAALDAL